jgi:hypothetical protein
MPDPISQSPSDLNVVVISCENIRAFSFLWGGGGGSGDGDNGLLLKTSFRIFSGGVVGVKMCTNPLSSMSLLKFVGV